ncbi:unnamed protein product [Blepharisma stoltei]|uniref:chitin synthase n=1 Tax=Blepharisma stoltei TaxID=1481888 RepID=A0AAU9JEP5_9CILI|nr:unnamed protein product [Blepharisma stoltei]
MIGAVIFMIAFLVNVNFSKPIIVILAFCTAGMFTLNVLLNNAILPILRGIVLFLFLTPTYVNIFNIYAICNIHDCTWGNRPQELNNDERERLSDYQAFRTRWLVIWVLTNTFFAYCINFLNK